MIPLMYIAMGEMLKISLPSIIAGDSNLLTRSILILLMTIIILVINRVYVNIILTEEKIIGAGAIAGELRGDFTFVNCSVKGNINGVNWVGGAIGMVYLDDGWIDRDLGKIAIIDNVEVDVNVRAYSKDLASGMRAGGIIGGTPIIL